MGRGVDYDRRPRPTYWENEVPQANTFCSNAETSKKDFCFVVGKALADLGFGIKFRQAFDVHGRYLPGYVGVHGATAFDRSAFHLAWTEAHSNIDERYGKLLPYEEIEYVVGISIAVEQAIKKLGLRPRPKPLSEYLPRKSPVIFEKTSSQETAVVVRPRELVDLRHPKVLKLLEMLGISSDLFDGLLNLQLDHKKILNFSLYTNTKEKKEDIAQQIEDTPVGKVEVSDCRLYPPGVVRRNDLSLQLKDKPIRGFQAILALSGKATLSFPERVEPIGGLYFGSDKRADVEMTPGTLAIILAPTASGWTKINGGMFEFRYISLPPWRPDYVRSVE